MVRFLARRLAGLAVTLLVASFLIFGGMYLAPGTPLSFLIGGKTLSAQTIAQIKAEYHLNEPFAARYWSWLADVLHGNLGTSLVFKEGVWGLIQPRIATTVSLLAYASLLIIVFGVVLGVVSGLREGRTDRGIALVTTVGLATPSFVYAIVLITVFAVGLSWFPVFGPGSGFTDRVWHLTLPAVALALSGSAYVARVTRAAVREERDSEHVDTARVRGIPAWMLIRRHVVRNALLPITTVAGLTIAGLIAGTVVVETAFGLNGLGSFLVQAVEQKDYAVVQALSLILVTGFVVVNTVVDIIYTLIDPRISLGGRRPA